MPDILTMAGGQALSAGMGMALGAWQDKRQLKQQEKLQKLQVAGSKELTDYNAAKQLQMWKDTSYGAQKEQMKLAGINPALMYGMGGGGGQSNAVSAGNVSSGQGTNTGGEVQSMMGMGLQMQLLKAQKENIEADTKEKLARVPVSGEQGKNLAADTANKGLQGELIKTENELKKVDLTIGQNTIWERVNEIVSRAIEQQEKGVQAGIQTEIQQSTIDDNIKRIKAEAINTGLQGAAMKAGIQLTEEQTRKVGQDIIQKWTELNQAGAKNEWEHHDRLKAIEEYTANALKVAGVMAVGNIVRDVTQIATRRIPKGKTTETYKDGHGTTIQDVQYR